MPRHAYGPAGELSASLLPAAETTGEGGGSLIAQPLARQLNYDQGVGRWRLGACPRMPALSLRFACAMLGAQAAVLLWALAAPVETCQSYAGNATACDWGTKDPCHGAQPNVCFPDWRSYWTCMVVLATLGAMASGAPPDVSMLA